MSNFLEERRQLRDAKMKMKQNLITGAAQAKQNMVGLPPALSVQMQNMIAGAVQGHFGQMALDVATPKEKKRVRILIYPELDIPQELSKFPGENTNEPTPPLEKAEGTDGEPTPLE